MEISSCWPKCTLNRHSVGNYKVTTIFSCTGLLAAQLPHLVMVERAAGKELVEIFNWQYYSMFFHSKLLGIFNPEKMT